MAKAKGFGNIRVVRNGKNATSRLNALVGNNHGTIVKGAVFEEYILNEALRDVGIDLVARGDIFVEPYVTLYNNECAHLLLRHAHAGHDDGHNLFVAHGIFSFFFIFKSQQSLQEMDTWARTDGAKKVADFFLKQHNQRERTHIDHLVENAAQQAHLKNLRHKYPTHDEDHNTTKDIGGARLLHQSVDVVKKKGYREDVDNVLNAKTKHRGRKWGSSLEGGESFQVDLLSLNGLFHIVYPQDVSPLEQSHRVEHGGAVERGLRRAT